MTSGADSCASCGTGPVLQYCASCGQRRITEQDLTLRGFFRESFHELTSLDGRLWATLKSLVIAPGQLAREYFDGRGSRYMKPLSLFVLMNLVFFIIQPHTGLLGYSLANYIDYDGDVAALRRDEVNIKRIDMATGSAAREAPDGSLNATPAVEPLPVFRVRFDTALQDLKKSMLIVSIPLLAIVMTLAYVGTKHRFAEHLVLSMHIYAFFLLFAGVFLTPAFVTVYYSLDAIGAPARVLKFLNSEAALGLVLFAGLSGYIFLSLRRLYGGNRIAVAARAMVLSVVVQALIFVYHDVLFWATLASL